MTQLGVHSLVEVHSLVGVACHHSILVPSVQSCCIWSNGNHVWGSMLCWLGAVVCSWGSSWSVQMVCDHCYCGWCVSLATCPGRLHPQVWSCGRLVPRHAEWQSGSQQCQLACKRVPEWFCHKFPKVLSLMAVCTDNMATQFVLTVLIIDHLTVVHQCLDVCDKILRVLSWPGYSIFKFSKVHMGVELWVIPCLIQSRKTEAFTLVTFCSSLLPIGTHCTCISRDLVPRAAKTYLRWSSLSSMMQLRRSQFSRVCQNMEKKW